MNILLTSVGRRAYLVRYFKIALAGKGKVIAINSDIDAAGMYEADEAIISPQVNSDYYIDFVCDVIRKNDIKLILSLFDIDLPYLSKHKSKIESLGAKLVVSSTKVIDISNDKFLTAKFCNENKFFSPKTFLNLQDIESELIAGNIKFPLIIKPRWGMGSLSVFKASDIIELKFYYSLIKKQILESYLKIISSEQLESSIIIQEHIEGDEYGLDVFNDLDQGYIQTVVKKKISMRSGETDMAEVYSSHELEDTGKVISYKLGHVGNLDVDVILTKDGKPYIIEFNARFGGGYPFSHLAGASFPEKLIEMVLDSAIEIKASSIKKLKAYKDIVPIVVKKV